MWRRLSHILRHISPSNEQLRLDKNVNKAFSTEMGLDMVHYTTEKNPPESPHCNTPFSFKSKMAAIIQG